MPDNEHGLSPIPPHLADAFVSEFLKCVAEPNEDWPTVRCWSKASLFSLLSQVKDAVASSPPSAKAISRERWLSHLMQLRIVTPIDVQPPTSPDAPVPEMYLADFAGASASADPFELLQATEPRGVICYSSAIAFHHLSTQEGTHYHIAVPYTPPPSQQNAARDDSRSLEDEPGRSRTVRNLLGKARFIYQGQNYYSIRRSTRMLAGIQLIGHGPRSRIRITDLEQTLLDTLYKPFHCGGPAVVFEAWEQALERLNETRLLHHLRSIAFPSTTRRVGAMLKLMSYRPGDALMQSLTEQKNSIRPDDPYVRISLLPGVPYASLDQDWLVNTP